VRLRKLVQYLDGNPSTLMNYLAEHQSPYTRVTSWSFVITFWNWLVKHGFKKSNPYITYKEEHSHFFNHAYKIERLAITFEEAEARIQKLPPDFRKRALEMLYSAQRYCEAAQPRGLEILGKGNKLREDCRPDLEGPDYRKSYASFYRALKKIGLKSHTLRKLALTKLVAEGCNEYDLMAFAGWSSIKPATSYIQPKRMSHLKSLLLKK
jgi:hypothetical protein